jgi:adenine phosphoribosyltransferase
LFFYLAAGIVTCSVTRSSGDVLAENETMTIEELKKLVRDIPDFPKPGVIFRDITPLLRNARGFAQVIDLMAERYLGSADVVLGIESRGFIVGAPVAYRLGVGFTIARKPGKLPYDTIDESYDLEYGSASLQMHRDGITSGSRVLIVDDLLATGGTAAASIKLAEKMGGRVIGCSFIIELKALGGRTRIAPVNCSSLIQYD